MLRKGYSREAAVTHEENKTTNTSVGFLLSEEHGGSVHRTDAQNNTTWVLVAVAVAVVAAILKSGIPPPWRGSGRFCGH
jgi:hypothetical protein